MSPTRFEDRASVIQVRALTKRFGAFTAVDRVSFDVAKGEIFGYLGANGAGKSTTIKMLCGLLRPTEGSCRVAGFDIAYDARSAQACIGYMSQKFSLYLDLPVLANLEFFAGAYRIPSPARRIAELSERVGIEGVGRVRTGDLPGGTRQKVALASALLHDPTVIFLDEPTAGVDPASRRGFWELIRELAASGKTILVTTHYLDEAEGCHRVGLMVDGKLVALDAPAGLKESCVPGVMRRLRGDDLAALTSTLRSRPEVVEVQPFGRSLHVRSPSLEEATRLEGWLRSHYPRIEVEAAEATLEDVFLEVVRTHGREEATS
ncbi:MAG: ABC transporter ATP-binding protein [Myxococcota bacterium]